MEDSTKKILIIFCIVLVAMGLPLLFQRNIYLSPDLVPTMHQFYGNITWPNGSLVQDGVEIYAIVNSVLERNASSVEGEYGQNPFFIIEHLGDESTAEFYLNYSDQDFLVATHTLLPFELTRLDLVFEELDEGEEYCGDGVCNNGETCSSCVGDCGACSDDGGGGGGGGGGGSSYTPPNLSNNLSDLGNLSGGLDNISGEGDGGEQFENLSENQKQSVNQWVSIGLWGSIIGIVLVVALISWILIRRKEHNLKVKF